MHLVYRALQGDMIPDQLPTELGKDKVLEFLIKWARLTLLGPQVPQPLSTNINMAELNVSYNGAIARVSLKHFCSHSLKYTLSNISFLFFALFSFCQPGSRPGSSAGAMIAPTLPPTASVVSGLPPQLAPTSTSPLLPPMPAMSNALAPTNVFPNPLNSALSSSPLPLNVRLFQFLYFQFVLVDDGFDGTDYKVLPSQLWSIVKCFPSQQWSILWRIVKYFPSQPASSVQAVPWVVNAGDRLRLVAACLLCSYHNFVLTGTRRSSSRQTTTRMVSYPGWRLRTCSCRPASLRISSLTFGTFATCGRWATLLTF